MLFSWLQKLIHPKPKTYRRPTRAAKRTFSLTLEALEDRAVPAFLAPVNYPAGVAPTAIAVGDFNGDGRPDIATVNNTGIGTVSVLLGNGDGTFQPAVSSAAGLSPTHIAV